MMKSAPTDNPEEHDEIITKDELLIGDWTPVRNEVWSSSVLSQGAKLCYIAICSHIWKEKERKAWPGQERLAIMLGVTDRSIRNYLRELEDVGIIKTVRNGLTRTNTYYICKPDMDALEPMFITERKSASAQERNETSAQERNEISDKEEAVKNKSEEQSSDSFSENSSSSHKDEDNDDDINQNKDNQQLPIVSSNPAPSGTEVTSNINGQSISRLLSQLRVASTSDRKLVNKTLMELFRKIEVATSYSHIEKLKKRGISKLVDAIWKVYERQRDFGDVRSAKGLLEHLMKEDK